MEHSAHEDQPHTNYFLIWVVLMVAVVGGVSMGFLPISHSTAVLLIFGIAFVKAWLVIRNFMHLRGVTPWLYALLGVPVLLALFMAIAFVPDIGYYVWRGPLTAPVDAGAGHGHGDAH